jgi:hypothetical protein
MTQNDTSFKMSVFWAPWENATQMCLLSLSSTVTIRNHVHDIKAVIASFLRKLQQNFAETQYFPIHTTKRVVLEFHKMNARLWLAKIPKFSQPNRLILGGIFMGHLELCTLYMYYF